MHVKLAILLEDGAKSSSKRQAFSDQCAIEAVNSPGFMKLARRIAKQY